jgi:hypothetical protein
MVQRRYIQVPLAILVGLVVSGCSGFSYVSDARPKPVDTSWTPKWDTAPDKNRKVKSALSPTVSFADQGFRGSPVPQNKSAKEQERKDRESFVESFRGEPQCQGITLKLKNPRDADFGLQVFNGIDGRTGRWQYVVYRMDTLERKAHGEATGGPNTVAKSVCSTIRETAFTQGGSVE